MAALNAFKQALEHISQFRRLGSDHTLVLEKGKQEAEVDKQTAENELTDAKAQDIPDFSQIDSLKKKRRECEQQLVFVEGDLSLWKQTLLRQSAIAYCTAFESFMRNFIIDKIYDQPSLLGRLKRKIVEKIIPHRPPYKEEVDDCITAELQSFQDVKKKGSVDNLYNKVLGKQPFGVFHFKTPTVATEEDLASIHIDIQILFVLRHEFIHRNGFGGQKYRVDMFGDKSKPNKPGIEFWKRLDPLLVGQHPYVKLPGPDQILESKAISSKFDIKLEEFDDSLLRYAGYIDEIYQQVL